MTKPRAKRRVKLPVTTRELDYAEQIAAKPCIRTGDGWVSAMISMRADDPAQVAHACLLLGPGIDRLRKYATDDYRAKRLHVSVTWRVPESPGVEFAFDLIRTAIARTLGRPSHDPWLHWVMQVQTGHHRHTVHVDLVLE